VVVEVGSGCVGGVGGVVVVGGRVRVGVGEGGRLVGLRQRADLVAEDAADGADRGHVVLVADALVEELVADLPGEDARVAVLVLADLGDDFGRGDARFGAADGAGQDGAGLLVAGEDLGDAAVGDLELAGDVAGPDAQVGHFDDAHADRVGQRAAVDEDPA